MEDNFFQDYYQFLLSTIPSAKSASGGKEVKCRCFYCPDSKTLSHSHFYISIPQTKDEPSKYYCQKCGERGYVTHNTLLDWGIWNDDIAVSLINHNRGVKYQSKGNKLQIYRLINNITSENDLSDYKLHYINNRLGTNYSYKDLRDLKIVLNLLDVLNYNHISRYTRNENIIDQLDKNFIGFVSIDNAFLNMRRVCDEGLVYKTIDKRYINYKLYDKFDTSERFYTIPSSVNLNGKERVPVHIAEGPFDILSIYNLRNRAPGIYTSIAGSNYRGIAMYFLENYKLPYTELHYYPDNDKHGKTHNIQKIAEYLKPTRIPVYVHRNTYPGEKDFGVKPDHISETIMQV